MIHWNRDFFKVQEPDTAFVAGWLMADGYVEPRGTVGIYLQQRDTPALERLALYLDAADQVRVQPDYNRSVLRLYSREAVKDLAVWGVTHRKTTNFVAPRVSPDMLPHFMRGVFEGDGSVNYQYNRVTLYGSLTETAWREAVLQVAGFNPRYRRDSRTPNAASVTIQGRESVRRLFDWMQAEPENVALDRKWDWGYIYG
jgi:hypothetical protein